MFNFNVTFTGSALYFAVAVAFAVAFWLLWHRDHKYAALVPAILSVLSLCFAIGWYSTTQLALGLAVLGIPYAFYRMFIDYRDDAAQAAKGKSSAHKDTK
jgi:phosphotransferase system  glucose/maltose/N-acetylglucosamine-specific IIC component